MKVAVHLRDDRVVTGVLDVAVVVHLIADADRRSEALYDLATCVVKAADVTGVGIDFT